MARYAEYSLHFKNRNESYAYPVQDPMSEVLFAFTEQFPEGLTLKENIILHDKKDFDRLREVAADVVPHLTEEELFEFSGTFDDLDAICYCLLDEDDQLMDQIIQMHLDHPPM